MTSTVAFEKFLSYQDAANWLDRHLDEMPDEMYLKEARLVFINGVWHVGISYTDRQLEFFDEI